MRNRFVELLGQKITTGQGEKVVVLTGDLGFSVLEPLQKVLGPRFINVGVAEALMASTAAGIAREGYKVFVYSITPFATFRCLEQIRNDICYQKADVTVVGVGAGFGYGSLGPTHHSLEDVAALWALPSMTVYSPADIAQVDWAFEENFRHGGPSYLRIGKGGEGELAPMPEAKTPGVYEYAAGSELSLICTGHVLEEVLAARASLTAKGISTQILSVPKIKPFPGKELASGITAKRIAVIEELNPYGGFSGQVSKALLENRVAVSAFSTISAHDEFAKVVGSAKFQRAQNQLDAASLILRIEAMMN